MRPEEAQARAREEVARIKAAGGYQEGDPGALRIAPIDRVTQAQLLEWALIEPDPSKLRSTRRYGAPITWTKRMLLRGLQQHLNEVLFQQSRFNIQLLRRVLELEERIEQLEKQPAE
jgi:hypothetical protein